MILFNLISLFYFTFWYDVCQYYKKELGSFK